jgi:hypothetical protein
MNNFAIVSRRQRTRLNGLAGEKVVMVDAVTSAESLIGSRADAVEPFSTSHSYATAQN